MSFRVDGYTALARSTLKIQIKVSMLSGMGPSEVFLDILKDLEVPPNEGSHFGYTQHGLGVAPYRVEVVISPWPFLLEFSLSITRRFLQV